MGKTKEEKRLEKEEKERLKREEKERKAEAKRVRGLGRNVCLKQRERASVRLHAVGHTLSLSDTLSGVYDEYAFAVGVLTVLFVRGRDSGGCVL